MSAPGIPYAATILALEPGVYDEIARTVSLVHRLAHGAAWARRVDPGAPETALHDAGNAGVFMGYDFHVAPEGPRLIEINTNAGGALLNGLHTASLCDPERLGCLCADLLPVETIEARIVATFRAEHEAVRGRGAVLRRVAIADERPEAQFLRTEFDLFRRLFETAGIAASVVDTGALVRCADGVLQDPSGGALDLVYLRDTDFLLATPRTAALRRAFLEDAVVVTPSPREHHLLADKRRLALLGDEAALRELGASGAEAAFLARIVPETRPLSALGGERAWRERRDWVFKPAGAFGSRGVYRGDKLTRGRMEEILRDGDYVAQRRIEPGGVEVETPSGRERMKFDVRAYAYLDRVLLLGARVYQGQVTNLRTPGGGFSAICVVRRASTGGAAATCA